MKHYNPSITEEALRIFNSKQGDFLSDEVSGPVATIEIIPRTKILGQSATAASGSATIFTTASDKDTYITGVLFSFAKDATCDTATGSMAVQSTIDGNSGRQLAAFTVLATTAERETVYVTFPALKIDRNVSVQFGSKTFTVGNLYRTATIYGYTTETTR